MNFDWLLGERKQLDPNTGAVINAGDAGGIFSNPNFIRMLGETGAGLSEEGSFGDVVGRGASNWARAEAMQEAGAKQLEEENTFRNVILKAITDGTILNSKDKNNLFDEATVSGNGDVNLKMKHTPTEIGFDDEEPKIESRNLGRGTNLPDFS